MKTIKLAYIGFGVLGKQIAQLIKECNFQIVETLIFDDIEAKTGKEGVFNFKDYKTNLPKDFFVCIGLGYKHLAVKQEIQTYIKQQGNPLLTVIHPTSYVSPEATIEEGVVMYPRCTIDAGVTIKSGTLLNNSVTVSHDTTIEKCCYISPGVTISGRVSVKERCFLGTGSLVANDVAIGADSIIGIGSVITKTLPQHTKGLGNPFTIKNIQLQ